jgi:hypothetical protein
MTKEEDVAIDDNYLDADQISLLDGITEGKKLFYRFVKKWRDLLDSLDKDDRLILLKMILEVSSYNEDICSMINIENSESYTDLMFFMLAILLQQKRIDRSNTSVKEKDVTLLDFMCK